MERWFDEKAKVEHQIVTIHILSKISISRDNLTIKFGQLIEFNMRIIFLEKLYTKGGREASPRPKVN